MIKRLTAFFMAVVMCAVLSACSTEPASYEEYVDGPILYKVSDSEGNVIWLFGSIHIGKEEFYPLPKYVNDAFASSDALAVEIDLIALDEDEETKNEIKRGYVYTDGTNIKDHISEETYNSAVAILEENGMYSSMMDNYMPMMWHSCISGFIDEKSDADNTLGVDRHLLKMAKELGKQIIEVEPGVTHYAVLAGLSDALQEDLLNSAVQSYYNIDVLDDHNAYLMDLWLSGDEYSFRMYLAEQTEFESKEQEAIYREYKTVVEYERNDRMTDFAEELLLSGQEVFFCVGAAHIIAEGSVADQLAARGYTVERVG